jgi:bacterioferritin
MQAKEGVVDRLNALLTAELTATHQYLVQAEMCRNWGYERLYHKLHEYSREELGDAEHLAAHILYFEGAPNLQRLGEVHTGTSAQEQLQLAVTLEQDAVALYAEAITHCARVGDYTTRNLLEESIKGEEEQIDWLETQLTTIAQIGLQNYLAQEIHGE